MRCVWEAKGPVRKIRTFRFLLAVKYFFLQVLAFKVAWKTITDVISAVWNIHDSYILRSEAEGRSDNSSFEPYNSTSVVAKEELKKRTSLIPVQCSTN